jgi:hypothetical protein
MNRISLLTTLGFGFAVFPCSLSTPGATSASIWTREIREGADSSMD